MKTTTTNNRQQSHITMFPSNTATHQLVHSHSVPINQRHGMTTPNPLLFRVSRSNVNESSGIHDTCTCTDETIEQQHNPNDAIKSTSSSSLPSSTSKSPPSWILNGDIPEFPPFFEIQRTHCIINDLSPNEIATNISTYLEGIAVSTLYDNENGVAHAELQNELRVLIRIFRVGPSFLSPLKTEETTTAETAAETTSIETASESERQSQNDPTSANNPGGVLVEISRHFGCNVQFHSVAGKILCAAKGMDVNCCLTDDVNCFNELQVPAELRAEYLKQFKIASGQYTA